MLRKKSRSFVIIGKLNKKILGQFYIKKFRVVITHERSQHIQNKHNLKLENFKKIMKEVIEHPDYILEDNKHIDTIILLKDINDKKYRLVIKLNVSNEEAENSIITFMKLNDRSYIQTIQNRGKILYGCRQK